MLYQLSATVINKVYLNNQAIEKEYNLKTMLLYIDGLLIEVFV